MSDKEQEQPYTCIIAVDGKIVLEETFLASSENVAERVGVSMLAKNTGGELTDAQIGRADIFLFPFVKRG